MEWIKSLFFLKILKTLKYVHRTNVNDISDYF